MGSAARRLYRMKPWLLAGSAVIAVALPFFIAARPFYLDVAIMVCFYALLGVGWNIIGGYTGQPALGNGVFLGLGAYSTALLLKWWGVTPWLGMFVGMAVAVIVAVVLGFACFRLRGQYFAIVTFTIGESVRQLFNSWWKAGGPHGLAMPILSESWLNFQFHSSRMPYYFIILVFLAFALLINWLIERMQLGYYLRAIKADQEAASSLGVNITKYKIIAFALCAVFTAMAGAFYTMYVLFIDPMAVFYFTISLQAMLVTILGGMGVLWGPLIGSIILVVLSQTTRVYWGGEGRALDLLSYGFLVMLLAVLEPSGLAGLARKLRARIAGGA